MNKTILILLSLVGVHFGINAQEHKVIEGTLTVKSTYDAIATFQTMDDQWLYTQWKNSSGIRKAYIGFDPSLTNYMFALENGANKFTFHGGDVSFSNYVTAKGITSLEDIRMGGSNSWIFHTPDDNRRTLHIAPKVNGKWAWEAEIVFFNNGEAWFKKNIAVGGKIEAKKIKVTLSPTADFVFAEDYDLPTLDFIEDHIEKNKSLPEIASAKEMTENGVNIGNFQIQLLQKIEELTLYTIQQEKEIKKLKKENKGLKTLADKLELLQSEIEQLKKKE